MAGKGERTQRAVLDAAVARFGRDGYRATSVADITRDAGVGGTVAYAYFPNKEALFLAAVDTDAAAVIEDGMLAVVNDPSLDEWRDTLVFTVAAAVDSHPLARRLLAGLEPDFSARVLGIPALAELRKACGERLRAEQAKGTVRTDIDAEVVGSGLVSILLSLLTSVVQLGSSATLGYAEGVAAVMRAALDPVDAARA